MKKISASRALIDDLVAASRILAQHEVLDAYGHVSVRHPTSPNRYLMSRSLGPALVTPAIIGAYLWIWTGFAMVLIGIRSEERHMSLNEAPRTGTGATRLVLGVHVRQGSSAALPADVAARARDASVSPPEHASGRIGPLSAGTLPR